MSRFIGIDLHKQRFTACYRDEAGEQKLRPFELAELTAFTQTLQADDEVAVEATANSGFFYQAVAPHVRRVHLVNPNQFAVVAASTKKTDRHDASLLALFLSKGMLPEVRPVDTQRADVKSLLATRARLVESRTALKNKIHSVLTAHGIVPRKLRLASQRGLDCVLKLEVNAAARFELELLVDQIRHLTKGLDRIEQQLKHSDCQLPGHPNVASITGIGDVGASTLLSVIGNVHDFHGPKQLTAYFGIAPTVHCSNNEIHCGPITKHGSRQGRHALVQCTLVAIHRHPDLHRFYERIKARRGSGKAIIATARKLLGLVYFTLVNDIVWADCANGVVAE